MNQHRVSEWALLTSSLGFERIDVDKIKPLPLTFRVTGQEVSA